MSLFSYSGDPAATTRDEVRFLIQDTEDPGLLTDIELDYVIGKWIPLYESAIYCASIAAGTIARKYASTITVSSGGVTAQVGDLQARYTEMAMQLKHEYEAEGEVGGLVNLENILAGTQFDPTIEPLAFSMKLDDNPLAGLQDVGGFYPGYYYNNPWDEQLSWY